jgi:hypothetical protein
MQVECQGDSENACLCDLAQLAWKFAGELIKSFTNCDLKSSGWRANDADSKHQKKRIGAKKHHFTKTLQTRSELMLSLNNLTLPRLNRPCNFCTPGKWARQLEAIYNNFQFKLWARSSRCSRFDEFDRRCTSA